jgi:hypothetical protein
MLSAVQHIPGRRQEGTTCIELTAALSLLVPLVMMLLFLAAQIVQAYVAQCGLQLAAQQAARELAILYASDEHISHDRKTQEALVFDKIRLRGVVNSSRQFANPRFSGNGEVSSVSVQVDYEPGKFGLPPIIDPLVWTRPVHLSATSAYRLESR